MKFYFEGQVVPDVGVGLPRVSIRPETNNSQNRELFILIDKNIDPKEIKQGDNFGFGLVGDKKTPMIFPPSQKDLEDKKILIMGNIPQPGHRKFGGVNTEKTDARMIDVSYGGGAWGAGCVFIALLAPGQKVVSTKFHVWENIGGNLFKVKLNQTEFELRYEKPEIEML